MRDPFSADRTSSDSYTARSNATRSRSVATRGLKPGQAKTSAKGKSARPRLPRVPGGKARARLHLFEQQREIEETDVKRKKPDKPSAKLRSRSAVMTRSARSRSRGPNADSVSPYLRAFVHKRDLDITAPASPVEQGWRPLGPFSIPHGQSYGRGAGSRPPVAGRIVTIAVDPGNASHILIGSGGGGVWE